MSCPNCGLETLPEQKFCRSCGTSLQVITQPIAERAAVSQIDKTTSKDQMQRANRFVLWGLIIMFIGAAYGVIGKMLIHENTVTVVGVLVALAGMFMTVYPYLLPSRRKQSDIPTQPERLTQSQPKALHESRVDYLPSITERTTNLLNNAARPKDKDSGALSR